MPETVSDATRQRITDVAIEAIRGAPVVALNAQDIAADAGVSTSAIYKAYGNKYELFAEASRQLLMQQVNIVLASTSDDAPPLERLRQLLAGVFRVGRDEPFAAAYIFCTFPTVFHGDADDSVVEHARALRALLIAGLRTHVGAAVDAGELAGDPAVLAELCAIDTFGYVGRSITSTESITPEQYATFMIGGLTHFGAEADQPSGTARST